jgi:hypothetical protein
MSLDSLIESRIAPMRPPKPVRHSRSCSCTARPTADTPALAFRQTRSEHLPDRCQRSGQQAADGEVDQLLAADSLGDSLRQPAASRSHTSNITPPH